MTTPASGDAFSDRRKALEDSFFFERDQLLLENLRLELEAIEEHRHLAHVSGILDDRVLMNLVKAGVKAQTLAAVSLIPHVEVAWSDGAVTSDEREAILKAAAENGIKEGSAAHQLLGHWLKERPDVKIVATWKEYMQALAKVMPADAMLVMRERIIGRCRKVAEASGWLLGIVGKVSKVEQSAIDEFERAMQP